jgi:valyl-tRNA synthetase
MEAWKPYAMIMAKADSLGLMAGDGDRPSGMATTVLEWAEVSVKAPEGFDFEKARNVLRKKLADVTAHHEQHLRRLSNPDFQAKAAAEMKLQIEQRAEELGSQRKLLEMQLRLLGGAE